MTDAAHPHQLHALAATWNVNDARTQLHTAVANERHEIVAEARTIAAAADVQGWRPVIGRGAGGHDDPTARAALGRAILDIPEPAVRTGRLGRLAIATGDTLRWLADRLGAAAHPDEITRIRNAIPGLRPYLAERLTLWLTDIDTRIRRTLHLDPAEHVLAGLACPSCGVRQLYALTASPAPTIVCRAGCHCAGNTCTCGMPIRPAGATHIWAPTSNLGRRAQVAIAA